MIHILENGIQNQFFAIQYYDMIGLIGIIYLENNFTVDAFTKERLEVLGILFTKLQFLWRI